jgi:hypothetical protein
VANKIGLRWPTFVPYQQTQSRPSPHQRAANHHGAHVGDEDMENPELIIAELRDRLARLEAHRPTKAALNLLEAASFIGRSATTLRKLHERGHGPRRTRNGRAWIYRPADLDRWLSEQTDAA